LREVFGKSRKTKGAGDQTGPHLLPDLERVGTLENIFLEHGQFEKSEWKVIDANTEDVSFGSG
jgi:hypothetical protein